MAGLTLSRSRQVPAEETPAFGSIAERFRRAGDLDRAIALCYDGLKKFPNQLSARVTLGWCLLDRGRYADARAELEYVLRRAPDNLAAIRGLAELHDREEHAMPTMDQATGWQTQEQEQPDPEQTSPASAPAASAVIAAPAAPAVDVVMAAADLSQASEQPISVPSAASLGDAAALLVTAAQAATEHSGVEPEAVKTVARHIDVEPLDVDMPAPAEAFDAGPVLEASASMDQELASLAQALTDDTESSDTLLIEFPEATSDATALDAAIAQFDIEAADELEFEEAAVAFDAPAAAAELVVDVEEPVVFDAAPAPEAGPAPSPVLELAELPVAPEEPGEKDQREAAVPGSDLGAYDLVAPDTTLELETVAELEPAEPDVQDYPEVAALAEIPAVVELDPVAEPIPVQPDVVVVPEPAVAAGDPDAHFEPAVAAAVAVSLPEIVMPSMAVDVPIVDAVAAVAANSFPSPNQRLLARFESLLRQIESRRLQLHPDSVA